MGTIDLLVVIAFFVILVVAMVFVSRLSKSVADFVAAGSTA